MEQTIPHISNLQLLGALGFVALGEPLPFITAFAGKDLLWGSARTFVQLFVMGYVLTVIFDLRHPAPVLAFFLLMIGAAAWIIRNRVSERAVSFFAPTLASMVVSYLVITYVVTAFVVGVRPWWTPGFSFPVGGHGDRQFHERRGHRLGAAFRRAENRRAQVEMMLSLGADYREASADMVRVAVKAA